MPFAPWISWQMLRWILEDFRACFERDPAARSRLEVLLTYSGFHATVLYRIAHLLWEKGVPLIPRLISHAARLLTGIEIHPGAVIGRSFFMDHGMGVVIGETTEIGDHVTLYQGVTLGGTGKEVGKRHPTIGHHVVIGTGAKVLGALTIGNHVRIGANAVVLQVVPDHATVVGVPGRVLGRPFEEEELDHTKLPDPVAERLERLENAVMQCREEIKRLEGRKVEQEKKTPREGAGEERVP